MKLLIIYEIRENIPFLTQTKKEGERNLIIRGPTCPSNNLACLWFASMMTLSGLSCIFCTTFDCRCVCMLSFYAVRSDFDFISCLRSHTQHNHCEFDYGALSRSFTFCSLWFDSATSSTFSILCFILLSFSICLMQSLVSSLHWGCLWLPLFTLLTC